MSDSPTLRQGSPAERTERTLRRWIADGTLPTEDRQPLTSASRAPRCGAPSLFSKPLACCTRKPGNGASPTTSARCSAARTASSRCSRPAPPVPPRPPETNDSDRDTLHGVLAALAEQELNAQVLTPDRRYRDGISPYIADLITGAVVLHQAAELPSVRGFLNDCAREHVPVTIHALGIVFRPFGGDRTDQASARATRHVHTNTIHIFFIVY